MVPANKIGDAAQERAPVSTRPSDPDKGSLKASKEVVRGKANKENMATVAVIFRDPAAVPTEYGLTNRQYPPRPWFRPAVDATTSEALRSFGTALTDEVEKAAARAAKKSKAVAG